MKKLQLLIMVATMSGAMGVAQANTIDYNIAFSGSGGVSVSGIIDVTDGIATAGSFYITGIANIDSTTEFTLLPGSGTYINYVAPTVNLTYDNIVNAGSSLFLDDNGLVFTGVNNLNQDSGFELWDNGGIMTLSGNPPYTYGIAGTANLTAVPDNASTVGLLGLGLGCLALPGFAKIRRQKA